MTTPSCPNCGYVSTGQIAHYSNCIHAQPAPGESKSIAGASGIFPEPAESPECIACKYSGSDEREYAAHGCPAHTCRPAEPAPAEPCRCGDNPFVRCLVHDPKAQPAESPKSGTKRAIDVLNELLALPPDELNARLDAMPMPSEESKAIAESYAHLERALPAESATVPASADESSAKGGPCGSAGVREWFIELRNRPNHRSCVRGPATVNADGTLKTVRVVEGSAYDALKAQVELIGEPPHVGPLRNRIAAQAAEIERLRAERDLLAKKFANADMLLGEHSAHVDKKEQEIEKLKAENVQLVRDLGAAKHFRRQVEAERDEYKGRFEDARKTALAHAQELTSRAADIATLTRELEEHKAERARWNEYAKRWPTLDDLMRERDDARAEVEDLRKANDECGKCMREHDLYREALERIAKNVDEIESYEIAREALKGNE